MILDKNTARKNFEGSVALFESCWKQYCSWLKGSIDNPSNQGDVDQWLEEIAAEKVNNPRSKFYLYG